MAILDADFLIALEQGDDGALLWLDGHHEEEHHVPDFVAVEYLTGHTDAAEALEVLDASFSIVHGDMGWIRSSVALRKALRKKGARFRTPDLWIASWASHYGTAVVTRNIRHFEALGVPVASW